MGSASASGVGGRAQGCWPTSGGQVLVWLAAVARGAQDWCQLLVDEAMNPHNRLLGLGCPRADAGSLVVGARSWHC